MLAERLRLLLSPLLRRSLRLRPQLRLSPLLRLVLRPLLRSLLRLSPLLRRGLRLRPRLRLRLKRGSGFFLVLAVSGLACLTIMAMSRLYSTHRTIDRAARGVGGAVAEQAAISIVENALWNFQSKVNDPKSRLFAKVRDAVIACKATEVDCDENCHPNEVLLYAGKDPSRVGALRSLELEEFSAKFIIPEVREDVRGSQFLEIDTTVSLKLAGRRMKRRVSSRYRWGLSHISQPKPYDQCTVAIAKAGVYQITLPTVAEFLDLMEEYNLAAERFNAFADYLEALGPERGFYEFTPLYFTHGLAPELSPQEERAIDEMYRRQSWRYREWERLTEGGSKRCSSLEWRDRRLLDRLSEGEIKFIVEGFNDFEYPFRLDKVIHNRMSRETPGIDSVTLCLEENCMLRDMDLNAELAKELWPHCDTVYRLAEELKEINKKTYDLSWKRLAKRTPFNRWEILSFLDDLYRRLSSMRREFGAIIGALNRFNGLSLGRTLAQFTSPSKLRPAQYGAQGYHINQRYPKEDLKELIDDHGGVNGHVFIAPIGGGDLQGMEEDEIESLVEQEHPCLRELDLRLPSFRGNAVVSSFRRVRLDAVSLADEKKDLLILGLQEIELTNGEVEGGLSCSSAEWDGSPRIFGNFVLGFLPFSRYPKRRERFSGMVDYDDRIFSGYFLDPKLSESSKDWVVGQNYIIGICPRAWEREVHRN